MTPLRWEKARPLLPQRLIRRQSHLRRKVSSKPLVKRNRLPRCRSARKPSSTKSVQAKTQGTADAGGVVWSVVQESPGNDLPPEPAIRADVTIPDRGINLRMIIRRNGDKSLPASHLVEMIFTVPDGFAGGSIDNVSRMTFKDTEQSPGSPLVGIPAKIADNFFIIAMNDAKTAIDTNMSLIRRQSWIDIPIAYKTGGAL